MYSPKIKEDQVQRLYKLRCSQKIKKPMTALVREAIAEYLSKRENHNKKK